MKYVGFSSLTLTSQANQWVGGILYKNISNNYILVMGITHFALNFTTFNGPFSFFIGVGIADVNGNDIDTVDLETDSLQNFPGTTTVWNGTSMESEPTSIPVGVKGQINRVGNALIPPQGNINASIFTTASGITATIGGWGLALDEDELLSILSLKLKDRNPLVIKL